MIFVNIEVGLQRLDNKQKESKPKRLRRAQKEKAVNPAKTWGIPAVGK